MTEDNQEVRRVFISYSWTSAEHVQWVMDLAERLMSDGIDVVLDKWELTEGQDKYAFMEKMVTDKTINKVLAVCDKRYAEKADGREGGVGTESQIISREVYEKVDQKKFIPIVTEYEDGIPCLPTFFKGRIYIDISTPEKTNENYQRLIRNIYDKPLDKKPSLGKTPSYILDAERIPSKTLSKLTMLREAIMKGRSDLIRGLVSDYLRSYLAALEDYRINWEGDYLDSQKVLSSIQSFLPYRDEFLDFITLVSQYVDDTRIYDSIHGFFEEILRYLEQPEGIQKWNKYWPDNYRFITYELFLYVLTALIKNDRFEMANMLISEPYFNKPQRSQQGKFSGIKVFNANPDSLRALGQKYHYSTDAPSATAEVLYERVTRNDLNFHSIMQTDFILCMRHALVENASYFSLWFPQTWQFIDHGFGPFELFIRAESHKYFEKLKILLSVQDKQDLESRINAAENSQDIRMGLGGYGFSVRAMLKYNNLERFDIRP